MNRKTVNGLGFGALLAVVFALLVLGFDAATGGALFALVVGAYLLLVGWKPWARLGMRLTSIGMYLGAAVLLVGGALALRSGEHLVLLRPSILVLLVIALLVALVMLLVDRQRHREEWEAWKRSMGRATLGQTLLGRHFPSR